MTATMDGGGPMERALGDDVRWLVVRGKSTAARFALPALGRAVIGRDPGCDVVIDEDGVRSRHAVLHLLPKVELEVLDGDAGIVRVDPKRGARGEVPLRGGATVDVGAGDEVRLGSVVITWMNEVRFVRAHRAWDRSWLEKSITARGVPGSVVVRISRPTSLGPEELERFLGEQLGAGDVLADLGGGDVALFLTGAGETRARALAERLLSELGGREGSIVLGVVEAVGAPAADLVDRAGAQKATFRGRPSGGAELVARDPAMIELLAVVDQVAPTTTPVLVLGETGTGKDLVAALLHTRSTRALRPLVRVSCAELELGDEGAGSSSAVVARAEGATLLLDEVGSLGPRAQVALGQLIEARDVRFIATSNQDLRARVKSGEFRKDLYFRLNRVTLEVPPLRDRPGDLLPLADHFLESLGQSLPRPKKARLSAAAVNALEAHRWPGNVRELKNVLERALLLAPGEVIEAKHLILDELGDDEATDDGSARAPEVSREARPSSSGARKTDEPASRDEPAPTSLRDEMAALERRRILEALEKYPTQADAAKALDIPLRTFLNRLDALGIARPRKG